MDAVRGNPEGGQQLLGVLDHSVRAAQPPVVRALDIDESADERGQTPAVQTPGQQLGLPRFA